MTFTSLLDTILSDQMLSIASVLLLVGSLVFLYALVRFVTYPRAVSLPDSMPGDWPIPTREPVKESEPESEATDGPEAAPDVEGNPSLMTREPLGGETPPTRTVAPAPRPIRIDMEKTVVLPPGVAEVQGQLEIALTQIKTLNRKVHELETELSAMARQATSRLDLPEWKDAPASTAEFSQKLLKLAEHVIVLEKDMARMKAQPGNAGPPAPSKATASAPSGASKPPIMPL